MLVSLFENNRAETFTVHILDRGLTEEEQAILTDLTARHGNSGQSCAKSTEQRIRAGMVLLA